MENDVIMELIRLDKYLADMQIGTRSEVKNYIRKGRISVNGQIIKSAEHKIDIDNAVVAFDSKEITYVTTEYYMLNKPAGVLSATMDKKAATVLDLIDAKRKDLFPVGRLDKDTEGLLIITNDGQLAHDLLSPKKHVDKLYYAKVRGIITKEHIEAFAMGLEVDKDFVAMPAKLEILNIFNEPEIYTEVNITIKEGKFHQIKRMFNSIGSEVLYLKRLKMGELSLDESLKPGEYRLLTEDEISLLKNNNLKDS